MRVHVDVIVKVTLLIDGAVSRLDKHKGSIPPPDPPQPRGLSSPVIGAACGATGGDSGRFCLRYLWSPDPLSAGGRTSFRVLRYLKVTSRLCPSTSDVGRAVTTNRAVKAVRG